MRVALINKVFSDQRGGGERYALTLARGLCERGLDVHLFGHVIEDAPRNTRTNRVPMPRWPASRRVLGFAAAARDAVARHEFDITYGLTQVWPVDCYFMGGGAIRHWLTERFANPVVRAGKYVLNPVNLVHRHMESRIFAPANHRRIVANSQLIKRHAMQYHNLPVRRIEVVYHGVDHDRYHPGVRDTHRAAMREQWGVRDDDLVVLLASHNWPRKGLPTLLEAVSQLGEAGRPVHVVAVGRSRVRPMAAIARRLGLSDRVHLHEPTARIEQYFAAADVFALPTRYDPFAAVTLEAMACGLPTITTSQNGGAEAIEPGVSGYVLEDPTDARTLAGRLATLLDPSRRENMGRAAADAARRFTWPRHFDQMIDLFQRVVAEKADTK